MILNTGCRTDIPAFYSDWLFNRVRDGYALTRNPYFPEQVLRYRLDPGVVDILSFCTKNPAPMFARLSELDAFRQFWFVTLTPYGRDVEPRVPNKAEVIDSIRQLSGALGPRSVGWRYDPIIITEAYSIDFHVEAFERMAAALEGYVSFCVISFLELYEKTRRNFPAGRAVSPGEQRILARELARIGERHHIPVRTCCENPSLAECGVDVSGCLTKEVLEGATGLRLAVPNGKRSPRAACSCLLGADIGMYNTCPHGCAYCYANYDQKTVARNVRLHDPSSPLLIGHLLPSDTVRDAPQVSYIDPQGTLF